MGNVKWKEYDGYLNNCKISQKEQTIKTVEKSFLYYTQINPAYQENAKVNGEKQAVIASKQDSKTCKISVLPDEKLYIGDIVECYDENWIVVELYKDEYGITSGTMLLTNNYINYQNNDSIIHSSYVVIDDGSSSFTQKEISTPNAQYIMYLPLNENTKKLYIDKRLAIGTIYNKDSKEILQVMKIVWIDKIDKNFGKGSHLLKIKLVTDVYNPQSDNFDKKICDYIEENYVLHNINKTNNYNIIGKDQIKIGTTRTYIIDNINEPFDWEITKVDGVTLIKNNNECKIKIRLNENLIGQKLELKAKQNDIVLCSKTVEVISIG